jgi:hypothetical protein
VVAGGKSAPIGATRQELSKRGSYVAFLLPAFSTKMDVVQIGCVAHLTLSQKRRKRRWWTHPALSNRLSTGQFHIMFAAHRKVPDKFFLQFRMSMTSSDELLNLIDDKTVKTDTNVGKPTGSVEGLAVTLSTNIRNSTIELVLFVRHNFAVQ